MEEWELDPRSVKLLNKVDRCGIALTKWSKKYFGSVQAKLKKKKKITTTSREKGYSRGQHSVDEKFGKGNQRVDG